MDPLRAFFSDGTKDYCSPTCVKPNETLTVRLRTPKDMKVKPLFLSDTGEVSMELKECGERYDYYECSVLMPEHRLVYAFKVVYNDRIYYYTKNGICDYYEWHDGFFVLPGFDVPEWAFGAVMYQIYPDRFCNGDISNDVESSEYYYAGNAVERVYDWNAPVAKLDVGRFYGGDLVGVRNKLDYLKELGVEVIYLNPVFVSPSNHKYDCQDYDHIDPHLTKIVKKVGDSGVFGNNKYVVKTTLKENLDASNAWFAEFVKDVHDHGMKIILDGVFNHCGSFNKWMDREGYYSSCEPSEQGAYVNKNSKYRDFFKFENPDNNNSYEGWWGFDTLPKLNYEGSEDLCRYICEIGAKWVSEPYNCDGWRLDVGADLGHSPEMNHAFWKRFRKAVKTANPNAIILAEHYGDASEWLKGDEWDTLMNYDGFMEPLTWFLTGMEKHSDSYNEYMLNNMDAFAGSMFKAYKSFAAGSFYTAMNELSNHDHSRFMTRTNRYVGRVDSLGAEAAQKDLRPAVFREAVVFQMTWPGAPTIYYGDEAGLCGFTDPDSRRTYPWGHEDNSLIELHKCLTGIRRSLPVLKTGSCAPIFMADGAFAFARFNRKSIVITVLNNCDNEYEIPVNLGVSDFEISALVSLLITNEQGARPEARIYRAENGTIVIKMEPHSSMVLKNMEAY